MKKIALLFIGICVMGGLAYATTDMVSQNKSYSWRYKMIVTIETPEGVVSGSAVRQMGDGYQVTFPLEASNYGEVSGEAVVVDLGERGVLFALISDTSDLEFYYTFPVPWGGGGETPEAYEYYASLPVGTKAEMPFMSFMPKLVTFTDMDDPKSVALVYDRKSCQRVSNPPEACASDYRGSFASVDRFEELFGKGVKLKGINLEITDESVTWGVVDEYLPDVKKMVREEWDDLSWSERGRIAQLIQFKYGDKK